MQHPQQVGGQSLGGYGHPGGGAAAEVVMSDEDQKLGDLGIAEAASPISSRPPAPAGIGNANFEEMIQATADAGGGSSSNRWPRQETLALLQIRSEMDIAFRDATLKGPLWDQVSRKLGELGYKRSAKKCKEKFENVHKYYKRTKEGRGGRQDGKSYKFFSQLEALHHTPSTSPLPRMPSVTATAAAVVSLPPPPPIMMSQPDPVTSLPPTDHHAGASLFGNVGISFSSDTSSSSGDDEEMEMEIELPDNRKRKRGSHGGGGESDERMMDFFEGLLKQVMQKQEAMQQRFLEAIEKREQDRMIREEAWKRQDMARIAREHDLMAQERSISASRDAAIIDFLQKITGQTIQLPAAPNPPQEQQQQPQSERRDHHQHQHQHQQQQPPQNIEVAETTTTTSDHAVVAATPQQQMMPVQDLAAAGGSNTEASSSRWPKAEVIALIKLRSGMESRYQEAGPKGPLWEEISAGMKQIGYSRSSKRCKEKWENINKYFKKVKESNKKRPEDAKTCPYFNELDALYRRKILGNTTSSSNLVIDAGAGAEQETKQRQDVGMLQPQSQDKDGGGKAQPQTSGAGAFSSNLFGEHSQSNVGGEKQPEDMLNKGHQQSDNYCNSINCSNSEDLDEDNYEEDDENEEYDEKTEEEMKMVYKIQFQRQNVGTSNGGGTTSPSFVAMVQ